MQPLASLKRLAKAASALGGFLIFTGILLIGIFILVLFNVIDIGLIANPDYLTLFIWALLIISVLDLVAGLILLRR